MNVRSETAKLRGKPGSAATRSRRRTRLVSLQVEPAGQTTFTANFATGSNVGQWTFGAPPWEQIELEGGNPGAFLHNYRLDSIGPMARTGYEASSIFAGNCRVRNVRLIGIDFVAFLVGSTAVGRRVSLILRNNNGTREDVYDDRWVYTLGNEQCPRPNGAWHSYSFKVPSMSPTLPDGWGVMNRAGRTEQEAGDLVTNEVDEVMFFWADRRCSTSTRSGTSGCTTRRSASGHPTRRWGSSCGHRLHALRNRPVAVPESADLSVLLGGGGDRPLRVLLG